MSTKRVRIEFEWDGVADADAYAHVVAEQIEGQDLSNGTRVVQIQVIDDGDGRYGPIKRKST